MLLLTFVFSSQYHILKLSTWFCTCVCLTFLLDTHNSHLKSNADVTFLALGGNTNRTVLMLYESTSVVIADSSFRGHGRRLTLDAGDAASPHLCHPRGIDDRVVDLMTSVLTWFPLCSLGRHLILTLNLLAGLFCFTLITRVMQCSRWICGLN